MDKNDRKYSNEDITVYWKPSECIHSTICYKELLEVFNPARRPWVNMKGAATDKIIDIVKKCPTQALSYTWNDGKKSEKPPEKDLEFAPGNRDEDNDVVIEPVKGGPLLVKGTITILGSGGVEIHKANSANFCRCGGSSKMPFCDGTHKKIGFEK